MTLLSLPDSREIAKYFCIGNVYSIIGELGNCFKVETDKDIYLILKERFV